MEEAQLVEDKVCIECCGKCMLIECCCEADRLQVIKDDEEARANGYVEINGRWIKRPRRKCGRNRN